MKINKLSNSMRGKFVYSNTNILVTFRENTYTLLSYIYIIIRMNTHDLGRVFINDNINIYLKSLTVYNFLTFINGVIIMPRINVITCVF